MGYLTVKARKRDLHPDLKGRYRPQIGYYVASDGEVRPKRFNLGTDLKEAERRYHRLHDLLAEIGGRIWQNRLLEYAEQIGAGEQPRFSLIPPPDSRSEDSTATGPDRDRAYHRRKVTSSDAFDLNFPFTFLSQNPATYAQAVEQERQTYPSLADLQPANLARYLESVEANKKLIEAQLRQLQDHLEQLGALKAASVSLPAKIVPGTYYEALDAYEKEFCRDAVRLPNGELRQTERKRVEKVARFKDQSNDFPLHELNKDRITELAAYWRKRPLKKNGEYCSRSHSKHHLSEFFRFLRWLDGCDKFQWTSPKGLSSISKKIARFEREKKLTAVTKLTYSPSQLKQINSTATMLERLALYVGLNCAMGAAELGRLVEADFFLDQPHPFAKQLGIETNEADNYLRYFRPKTSVFGEFWLWAETVEMVRWGIDRAKKLGSKFLFCRDDGRPQFNDAAKKPDGEFANQWKRCCNRSRVKPKLPFGSLRDTLPNYLRLTYNSEIASICLTHGTPGVDKLIDCYANRPFGQQHRAIQESRAHFAPMFGKPS